jgi:hypothetical protein
MNADVMPVRSDTSDKCENFSLTFDRNFLKRRLRLPGAYYLREEVFSENSESRCHSPQKYLARLKYIRITYSTSRQRLLWDIGTKTVENRPKVTFYMKKTIEINFLPICGSMSHNKLNLHINLPSVGTNRIVVSPTVFVAY